MSPPPFNIAGLEIHHFSQQESLSLAYELSKKKPARIFWANVHSICLSEKNRDLKQALQQCEFLLNDGIGIELASRLKGKKLKDNLNGTDWIPAFLDFLNNKDENHSLFLLGSKQEVINRTKEIVQNRWQKLKLKDFHHGFFQDPEDLLKRIEAAHPAILIVGMGVPQQELFITENWQRLQKAGVRIAIGGGAIFDFLTNHFQRAPKLLRSLRLEWLFRIYLEPGRLFRRYFFETFEFLKILLKN